MSTSHSWDIDNVACCMGRWVMPTITSDRQIPTITSELHQNTNNYIRIIRLLWQPSRQLSKLLILQMLCYKNMRKPPNLTYEVAADVWFGHELANSDFWVTKLPRMTILVSPWWPSLVWWCGRYYFLQMHPLELCFFSFENLITIPPSLPKYPWKRCALGIDPESSNSVEAKDLPILIWLNGCSFF
jgi:hypothetical protein